jgi:diguanylate cyclase (GGDEF)-like protein/PAS domain S-box-containing protein
VAGLLLAFVVSTVVAAIISAALAVLSWQRRGVPGSLFFAAVMVGTTVWCAAHVGELTAPTLDTRAFFSRFAYIGITTVPPSWFLFCLSYSGRLRRRVGSTAAIFYLMPLATVVFVMLSPSFPLVWSAVWLAKVDGITLLVVQHGPWFWVHTAYCYACLAVGSALLLTSFLRRVRVLTGQGLTLVLAVALPLLANAAGVFHVLPTVLVDLDPTSPVLVASGVCVVIALWRFEMLDVFPGLVTTARDAVIGGLQDGVLVVDGHGRVLDANRAAGELLGTAGDSMVGTPLSSLLAEGSSTHAALRDLDAVDERRLDLTVPRDGEHPRHIEIAVSAQGSSRHAGGHVLVMRDITQRVTAEQALRASSERLRVLFEQSPVGVMVFDRDLVVTECNERLAAVFRTTRDRVLGHSLVAAPHAGLLPLCRAALEGETSNYNGPYSFGYSGEEVWLQGGVSPLRDDTGDTTGGIAVLWDMTQTRRAEELIERLAVTDAVTGLPNRTMFRDRLSQALAKARRSSRPCVVALVNLDRFKAVNEAIGHAAADTLLQAVGRRLQAGTRSGDTVGRWGGDKFAMLLPELGGDDDGLTVAGRLAGCFTSPWLIDGHELWLTASVGLAIAPTDGDGPQMLLENAEAAMDAARKLGGNCHQFYAPEMNARVDDRVALTSALHRACEEQQFVVYYQPQIELPSMRVVGCEALVRWQHPERGLVPPGVFIPLAEETGLMRPIGEWVLRQACTQAAAWEAARGRGIRMAVNLSARQFQQRGLVEAVDDALIRSGLPPRLLELELTETSIMADPQGASRTLREIAAMGVSVALDDFGTGYSSLTFLRQLPINRLKIDRSFVSSLPDDADDCAIAVAVIDLAHNLGLDVIGEGVETWDQVRFLHGKGCNEVQGFLFSKPEPPDVVVLTPDARDLRVCMNAPGEA